MVMRVNNDNVVNVVNSSVHLSPFHSAPGVDSINKEHLII